MFETKIDLGRCPCLTIFNRKMVIIEYFDEEINAMVSTYFNISDFVEAYRLMDFKDKFEKRFDFYG